MKERHTSEQCEMEKFSYWMPLTIVMYFGATISNRILSNFLRGCPVWVGGIQFLTTEHAYQSRLWKEEYRWWFGIDGPFNSFEDAVKVGFNFGETDALSIKNKIKYWSGRCEDAIGIIPKMLSNRTKNYCKYINFHGQSLPRPAEHHDFGDMNMDDFWIMILSQKFKEGKAKDFLMETKDKTLVEFDRGAVKRGSFWGGLYNKEGNKVYGCNYMGQKIMEVRNKMMGP